MDPNETLKQMRANLASNCNEGTVEGLYLELCDLVDTLDEWLSKGGFLPDDWDTH